LRDQAVPELLKLVTSLRTIRDETSFLRAAVEGCGSLFPGAGIALQIEDAGGAWLRWKVGEQEEESREAPPEGSPLSRAAGQDAGAVADAALPVPGDPPGARGAGLFAPIRMEEERLGALGLIAPGGEPFPDGSLEVAAAFGHHLALAWLQMRAQREDEVRRTQLTAVLEATLQLNKTIDLDKLLNLLMDIAVDLTGAEAGSLLLKEEETGRLYFKVGKGEKKDELKNFKLEPGEGIAGWVATEGKPVNVSEAHDSPHFSSRVDEALKMVTRSLLCVPLKVRDELIGSIEVLRLQSNTPFTEADQAMLISLANQAAITVKNARLYRQAITDGLTGLYTHRYFQDALDRELKLSERTGHPLSLILLDIDHFKRFNDTYGHAMGDEVLRNIAGVLNGVIRYTDVVARYGGEEFVVALRDITRDTVGVIADRIRKAVEALELQHEDELVRVTVSLGTATYPTDTPRREKLFYLADSALYAAKRQGRNRVCPWSEEAVSGSLEIE
jgi:diguanylate cyclase (GGDEF)-like protein